MNVKRYFAKTARLALQQLKAELGSDAIVLSNRSLEDGVEILALPAEEIGALPAASLSMTKESAMQDNALNGGLSPFVTPQFERSQRNGAGRQPLISQQKKNVAQDNIVRPFIPPRVDTADHLMRQHKNAAEIKISAGGRSSQSSDKNDTDLVSEGRDTFKTDNKSIEKAQAQVLHLQEINQHLMKELGDIRGMIEKQLAGFAWGEARRSAPARADVIGELLATGFSAQIVRKLAELVPGKASFEEARKTVQLALGRNMRAVPEEEDIVDQGGVYALVGPTGAGKTTTTAKIAARCVLRHGAERVALMTTDGYRIGAQEQLRIYGRILGVPVFPVKDAPELRQTLHQLSHKHIVLIDTVGMSQRDSMVAQQTLMLNAAGQIKRLLLLNAVCRGDTLEDVVRAYRGADLSGCIMTKTDEAATLGPVLGAAIQHALPIYYVTNGQRVPEDLHLPNRKYLLHRALQPGRQRSAWRLEGDEAALMMAAGQRVAS